MAKPKGLQYGPPKPKTSLFLCCFGYKTSTDQLTITGSEHNPKQKTRSWFPWRRIIPLGLKNQTPKTVPLEVKSKGRASKVHSSKWKEQSKSNLPTQTPATTNPQPPTRKQQNGENNSVYAVDTRQRSSLSLTTAAPAMSRAVSLPTAKRHVRRLLSSSTQPQTTSRHPRQPQNAKRYSPMVGMSVIMVALATMILWGRLCAILCTSAWWFVIPSFRMTVQNDEENSKSNANSNSNDLDLDSEVHKKKVILEGLLERNHRAVL